MLDIQKRVREEAKKLLASKKVDLVIGFEEGTLPLRASPTFIYDENEVERLIWNSFCENNLAKYLVGLDGKKIGIIAKGCDTRSIVALIAEKQITREKITIIGLPCQGMLDRRKIQKAIDGEITSVSEDKEKILLKGDGFEKTLVRNEYLYPSCIVCKYRNPVIFDVLIGEKVTDKVEIDEYVEVSEYEKKSAEERWEYFTKEISKCIRCYACRQACPMCYCEECFVDSSHPKWIEKGLDLTDIAIWHITRAYHQTGRCVDCGSCERACPMEINLRFLTKKINKDVKELFNFETGLNLEVQPPLATFKLNDRQDFIK